MSSSRATFISGMTFGIAVGLVVGHFFIWQHAPTSPTDTDLGAPSPYFSMDDMQHFEPVAVDPPKVAAVPAEVLNQPSASPSPLDHAIAISDEETVVTAQIPEISESTPEPQPLAIDQAAPLAPLNQRSDAEIRALIELELPNAPQGQRDVWFDALKDLGEEDVAGVLRMWKLFGGPQTDILSDAMPESTNDFSEPLTSDPAAHQSSNSVSQRNLSMIDVPGYKRLIPAVNQNEHRIDFQPGAPVVTEYPLDVALQGHGFFKLTNEAGDTFYTRNGQLCVLPDRTIGLRGQQEALRFEPLMTVPAEATGPLKVSRDGEVNVGEEKLGTLSVVTFWNLDYLTVTAPGIFSAKADAHEYAIEFELHVGAYEGSNVDVDREQIALKLETLK